MSADVNRYDQFSESQMATICRLRNLQVPYASWLDYTLALLANDRKLSHDNKVNVNVELAVTTAAKAARSISDQRLTEWRLSTHNLRSMPVEEQERRYIVNSAITDGSFQLSPTIEREDPVGDEEAKRSGTARF